MCEVGKYQPNAGALSCNVCPAGEAPNQDKTECVKCNAVSSHVFLYFKLSVFEFKLGVVHILRNFWKLS